MLERLRRLEVIRRQRDAANGRKAGAIEHVLKRVLGRTHGAISGEDPQARSSRRCPPPHRTGILGEQQLRFGRRAGGRRSSSLASATVNRTNDEEANAAGTPRVAHEASTIRPTPTKPLAWRARRMDHISTILPHPTPLQRQRQPQPQPQRQRPEASLPRAVSVRVVGRTSLAKATARPARLARLSLSDSRTAPRSTA